jgi:hypothetical protein
MADFGEADADGSAPLPEPPQDPTQVDPLFGGAGDAAADAGVLPPWAQPLGNDVTSGAAEDEPLLTSAERKRGVFMPDHSGPVTRQEAIEYINVQRWAREGCSTFVYVSILWLSFLLLVDLHTHAQVSYGVYKDAHEAMYRLVAQDSRGIAPAAIFSAAGESMCSCTCPALCVDQGQIPGGESLPGVPVGAPLFNGTVLPEQLQTMRAKSHYLRNLGNIPKTITLSDVNSIPEVWFWLQHGMIPQLWHEEARHLPVNTTLLFGTKYMLDAAEGRMDAAEKPGHFLRWNQVIGGVRLRQRRLSMDECRADSRISSLFNQRCHNKHESIMPFGPGTTAYVEGFVADGKERGAFDIYLDTERPVHIALETIAFMLQAHHWIDASTKSVQIQVPIINLEATPALYGLLEVRFDFTRSGDLTKKVKVDLAAANPYSGFSINYIPDIAYIVLWLYLFFKKFYQAARYFLFKRERHDVLCNFWFLFDWAMLIFGLCSIVSWFYLVAETQDIGHAVTSLSAAPAFDASEVLIKSYHEQWGDILDRILTLTVQRDQLRLAQFGYSMILIFQFIKAYRGQPKMAQLTRTLINATEDLVHFLACFIVLFLTFAFTGHLVYGMRLEEWSSSTKCINSAFRALKGDVDLPRMYEIAPMTTIVWFWMFLVVLIFIMMNLLLATVYDHYQLVKDKANAMTGIALQFKDGFRDLWHREGCKMFTCFCCCRCRSRSDYPSHADMLEELMSKANYNATERHHVFRTVLGPKWMRKKTEKHVFAGEIHAEHIKLDELAPAAEDLKQFGVDQDYIHSLLEDAHNYREREFDPEEVHVNQMRELVTLAEIEMATMRRRLDGCQGHMRLTMHDLARRLEGLEKSVHTSLAELVYIAGAAGVPDRTEHQAQLERLDVSMPSSKPQAALADTYKRVKEHLGQGIVGDLKGDMKRHKTDQTRDHKARQQNNTFGRIHNGARVANAFGEEDLKRQKRNYAMHV